MSVNNKSGCCFDSERLAGEKTVCRNWVRGFMRIEDFNDFLRSEVFLEISGAGELLAAEREFCLSKGGKECCFLYIKKGNCAAICDGKEYVFLQDMVYTWVSKQFLLTNFSEDFEAVYFVLKNATPVKNYVNYERETIICVDMSP